jgi:hypothetical protein
MTHIHATSLPLIFAILLGAVMNLIQVTGAALAAEPLAELDSDKVLSDTPPPDAQTSTRIVREATGGGSPPPRTTPVVLTGSKNKGGRIAVDAARLWLMEQGLRIVERRANAKQVVVVEYTHPLTVQIRGVDLESGEVRWAGGAHVEGDLDQVDASILTEVTRQALETAWGLP